MTKVIMILETTYKIIRILIIIDDLTAAFNIQLFKKLKKNLMHQSLHINSGIFPTNDTQIKDYSHLIVHFYCLVLVREFHFYLLFIASLTE